MYLKVFFVDIPRYVIYQYKKYIVKVIIFWWRYKFILCVHPNPTITFLRPRVLSSAASIPGDGQSTLPVYGSIIYREP